MKEELLNIVGDLGQDVIEWVFDKIASILPD
jgi:hypothetical protein